MRKKQHKLRHQLFIGMCLFFFAFTIPPQTSPTCSCADKMTALERGKSSISGTVGQGDNNTKTKKAPVFLYRDNKLVAKTKSDNKGNYTFKNIPKGNYEIRVCLKSGENTCVSGVMVEENKTLFLNVFVSSNQ
jgi:hypothetical protein